MTFYVYIAGPLSGPPAEYLANVSRFNAASRQLMDEGFCPINPAADMAEGLASDAAMSDAQYKGRSMDLLRLLEGQRAALLVLAWYHRDGTLSSGVAAEVREAWHLRIHVSFGIERLRSWRRYAEEER